ncbi:MAG TPA: restriction endonuclease [Herpetosiphonaceae bacterium]|nr:restriction endonuclease [Herpetosiphonaceae bacterium]
MPGSRLDQIAIAEPRVLVLAAGDDPGSRSNARGHLFEEFISSVLHRYGYNEPTRTRLNVTADGIELDVTARHQLTDQPAIAECKAYSSPVPATALDAFYGKLTQARFSTPETHGFFVALPRLTGPGDEQARNIDAHDKGFTYINAELVVSLLRRLDEIGLPQPRLPISSDPAVLITPHGVYAAALELDAQTRLPIAAVVWGHNRSVPQAVKDLVDASDYSTDLDVRSLDDGATHATSLSSSGSSIDPVIVSVEGSRSDFEYQLPASPKFFVGRKRLVSALDEVLDGQRGAIVLNAQSGWGKSSLALMLRERTASRKGHALVIDTRTAAGPRYITEVLRAGAHSAAQAGLLTLPPDASWGSLRTALRSLAAAEWSADRGPLVIFFDQFENVFRDERLTREFRDLTLGLREVGGNLIIGFAWKTDLVDWTEGHPYKLRDEIRASAKVLTLSPLGADDVNTILRRLERALNQSLTRELRQRLREYSQGLPWLLKKLSGHLLSEVLREGATQERLASEALNVQALFDSDLAELGPVEQEALKVVARYAPVPATEITERFPASVIQSLLDRRLVVQVGERLDTYWDIFRDYLNTGRVPVEDSYIIRQSPRSVGRLLRFVAQAGNPVSVASVARALDVSDNAVYNLSRELRLLGVAAAEEPNRVRLVEGIWTADDREEAIRRHVASALRRHKAHTTFVGLAERGPVDLSAYARSLPASFPAVDVSNNTWIAYARAFLFWFEYAGLAMEQAGAWKVAPDSHWPETVLLTARAQRRIRGAFPHGPPGPSLGVLQRLASNPSGLRLSAKDRKAVGPLVVIGAVEEVEAGKFRLADPVLVRKGMVVPAQLLVRMRQAPGATAAIRTLERNPTAPPATVGSVIRDATQPEWTSATLHGIGKNFRAWARAAGVDVRRPVAHETGIHVGPAEVSPATEQIPFELWMPEQVARTGAVASARGHELERAFVSWLRDEGWNAEADVRLASKSYDLIASSGDQLLVLEVTTDLGRAKVELDLQHLKAGAEALGAHARIGFVVVHPPAPPVMERLRREGAEVYVRYGSAFEQMA